MNINIMSRLTSGIKTISRCTPGRIALLGYIVLTIISTIKLSESPFIFPFQILLLSMLILLIMCFLVGAPLGATRAKFQLTSVGLTDSNGNAPLLTSCTEADNGSIVLTFNSPTVSLKTWQDKKHRVETALNITITSIKHSKDNQSVIIKGVRGDAKLPDLISWNDSFMPEDSATLLLGQSLTSNVCIDLSKVPMWIIGGATGSGKSVLTKLIARQCIAKDFKTAIVDFKGGMDYDKFYRNNARFITDIEGLAHALKKLLEVLETRKKNLSDFDTPNIDKFNEINPHIKMNRCILIIDEVAEVLDKSGLTKEQKQLLAENIEAPLATLARQGRAVGIHLIFSLQRPDADILNGQIRSNITGRIAGRCDNNLSMLIFDSIEAAESIDIEEQGTFIINDDEHTKFKAFFIEE